MRHTGVISLHAMADHLRRVLPSSAISHRCRASSIELASRTEAIGRALNSDARPTAAVGWKFGGLPTELVSPHGMPTPGRDPVSAGCAVLQNADWTSASILAFRFRSGRITATIVDHHPGYWD